MLAALCDDHAARMPKQVSTQATHKLMTEYVEMERICRQTRRSQATNLWISFALIKHARSSSRVF